MSEYQVLTSNGFKDFDDVIFKGTKDGLEISTEHYSIKVTDNHKFYINGKFVYANTLKIGDLLETDTGLEEITKIVPVKNIDVYDLLNVSDGHHFTANNIEVSNCAFIKPTVFSAFMDSVMPAQSALAWKKNLFISTANGMNHF